MGERGGKTPDFLAGSDPPNILQMQIWDLNSKLKADEWKGGNPDFLSAALIHLWQHLLWGITFYNQIQNLDLNQKTYREDYILRMRTRE